VGVKKHFNFVTSFYSIAILLGKHTERNPANLILEVGPSASGSGSVSISVSIKPTKIRPRFRYRPRPRWPNRLI